MPETRYVTTRMHEALELTFQLHGRDLRKGSQVPYIAHPLAVCALVTMDGGHEDESIAALLHDALEDKPEEISRKEITERFGARVLAIIEAATDTPFGYKGGPKPPWRERKEAYLAHIRVADPRMLRVSIADKIDNARAILADHRRLGDDLWHRFNASKEDQLWYYKSAVAAFETAGCQSALLDELRCLVAQLIAQVNRTVQG